ncbi:MAG: hypothetical protein LUC29_06160 [Acidaminococcaceae bacterium]|nr:hypothetical protein [Acidaminococcaceae bacterium]
MRKPDWGGKNNKLFYYNLLITGVVIAVLLTTVIYYVSRVRQELWPNSVNSVLEITIQGRNNLQKQLERDFEKTHRSPGWRLLAVLVSMRLRQDIYRN